MDVASSRKPALHPRYVFPPLSVTMPCHGHYCPCIERTPLPDSELPRRGNGSCSFQIPRHLAQTSVGRPQGNAWEMNEPISISTTPSLNPHRWARACPYLFPRDLITPRFSVSKMLLGIRAFSLLGVWRGQSRQGRRSAASADSLFPIPVLDVRGASLGAADHRRPRLKPTAADSTRHVPSGGGLRTQGAPDPSP